jgi:sulfate adenylyltransferase
MDAEQIAIGTFSPLEGFMRREELDGVVSDYRLTNNVIWPVPIVLQVGKETVEYLKTGENVLLALEDTGDGMQYCS